MELPFEKTVCRYWKQMMYTLVTREETQEMKIPDSMPDVGRVISSWGQVILRGKDWRDRRIGLNGGVMVWVLYAPEDGGALQRLETWIPFQTRTDCPETGEDGVIRVETFLRNLDVRAVSSKKLMVRTGIGLLVQALAPDEMELVQFRDLPPDLETRMEHYPIELTREAGEKAFLIDEDLSLPERMPPVEQLVYYSISPEILEQKVLGSKSAFRGMANLHTLYMDPDGRLNSHDFQIPFAQYVDLDGEYEQDAVGSSLLCVTSLELDPEPDGTLHLKCGVVSQHIIRSREDVELLEDCYSPVREVELERELVSIPGWLESQHRSEEFSGTFPAEEGQPVDLTFFPDAPTVSVRSTGVDVELGGAFQRLTQNSDGAYSAGQVRENKSIHLDTECDTVCFPVRNGSVSCRPEGASWRTDTQVVFSLDSICKKPMEMVTGVKIGEPGALDPGRPSVIIRSVGKQDSLWDLSKRYGSTVSAIKRLNKLEGEPEEDRLLLIPVL